MLFILNSLKRIVYFIINYIFPPTCLSCSTPVMHNKNFCHICWNKLNFITNPCCKICGYMFELFIISEMICGKCLAYPPEFDVARSLLKFDEHSKYIIHAFKYFDKTVLSEVFARLSYQRYYTNLMDCDLIVPIPMNRFKRLFRMYNPAQLFAKNISDYITKPLIPDLLIKTKWTKSQTFLSRKMRLKNLRGSIKFNSQYNISGKKILLIDDVITTGSTINLCSKLLRKAGAHKIFVLTILTN